MSFLTRVRTGLRRRVAHRLRDYLFFELPPGSRFSDAVRSGRIIVGKHTIQTPQFITFYGDEETKLRIGSYSSISTNSLMILGGEHHPEWVTTFGIRSGFHIPGEYLDGHPGSRGDVVIGSDVWLCPGTIVRSGITIGDGAVVGAGSVVTSDVRPYAIVAGNPAREVRRRFTDQQIERLEKIAWWDWPDEKVISWVGLLCSDRIDEFIEKAEVDMRSGSGESSP